MENIEITKKINEYLEENESDIALKVVEESRTYEDIECFFNDLLHYGCISWMIWSLVRYTDTHKFFDDNYYEIEEMRFELQEEWCLNILPDWDYKNYFAWLAFEETARKIADYIGMEL